MKRVVDIGDLTDARLSPVSRVRRVGRTLGAALAAKNVTARPSYGIGYVPVVEPAIGDVTPNTANEATIKANEARAFLLGLGGALTGGLLGHLWWVGRKRGWL